ncbi:MAG: DUF3050 domain-containing protein [Planctomycetes bacterium]|nr:DUF3050 domain-containing protein [Planctomycetota bacterium]
MSAQHLATKSSTEAHYAQLESDLLPLRTALVNHAVYRRIGDPTALRVFMSNHAFAVWDFMSLLKALQRRLTCIEVPWLPPADTTAARLINEIVLGEETDEVTPGRYASHYDLYLEAMLEVGADSRAIRGFVSSLRDGISPEKTLAAITLPDSTRQFVLETLRTCSRPVIQVAASFLLGREDLVPSMFRPILASLEAAGTRCETFRLYLERHVHLDEEQHGPMARRLLASLCGTDEANWRVATDAAAQALKSRCALWDGVLKAFG